MQAKLEEDPRIDARIVEDPEFLASPLIADYDVILLEFYNPEPLRHQAEAQKNLAQLVDAGQRPGRAAFLLRGVFHLARIFGPGRPDLGPQELRTIPAARST